MNVCTNTFKVIFTESDAIEFIIENQLYNNVKN